MRGSLGFVVCLLFSSSGCERGELVLLPENGASAASLDAAFADQRAGPGGADGGRQPNFGGSFQFECSSNAQCGGRRLYCDPRTRRCVECLQEYDCPRPSVCDTSTSRCVLPCQTESDCSGSAQTRCDLTRHICVGCLTSAQCVAPTPYCSSATGECVECLDSSQCSLPWRFCSTFRNECVQCLSDQNCPTGQVCGSGRCFTR